MAEIVVSAFFSLFFNKLTSEAIKKIARAKGIQSELKQLKRSLTQINNLLYDAYQKEVTSIAVKDWLNNLQHLAYDIDDVLDELATEAIEQELTEKSGSTINKVRKLIPTCCTNFSLSSRMHAKLDDIATKLQELVDAKNNLGLRESVIPNKKTKNERYEGSVVKESVIVGREGVKKALVQMLKGGKDGSSNQNFSIVPIVGMGGVGKTTLARLLYDEKEVKDHFEVRAWVCVSDVFDVSDISKVIYQSVTGEKKEFEDLNLLQEALKKNLQNKLFLIVLDDVWSESYDDWENLAGPLHGCAPGSRVIITTRKKQLLEILGFSHLDPLSSLSHDDAMCLFSQHALGVDNLDSHPTLKPLGEGLVKKCDGLPLALRSLGRLLRTKIDEEEWKEVLNSEIWELGKRDEIIPALRLSYHDLSASLKLLFAYCSLFPKDYVFDREELILLWMAEGFLQQSSTSKSMERLGLEYFEELASRSFFQQAPNDKSLFVMHDLMNDLATFVAGHFFSRLIIEMKKELRNEDLEKCRHFSFVCEEYISYKRLEVLQGAKSLRTCLALSPGGSTSSSEFYFPHRSLYKLVDDLPLLRVLSFSHLKINELPESIGGLKHLRYLNFSHTRICELPETVCNLYNLQTLIVSGCSNLEKLPKSFSKLKNLRHFDWRNTPLLKKMPLGIGELKSLRTLSKIIIEGENGFSIADLKDLKDLEGKFSIKGLDKVQNQTQAQEANISQKRVDELEVEWSDVFDGSRNETVEKEVLNVLKPGNDHLKKLKVVSYGGTEFPKWVGDPSFLQLTRVSIKGCKKCTSLPPLGQLPSLKKLSIKGMDEVKVVGLEFFGTTGVAFPSLETLSFYNMKGWEEWSTNNSNTAFPCLEELRLDNCPNLAKIMLEALPSLKDLRLFGCDHCVLKSLVLVASSVTRLDIRDISGLTDELWRGVMKNLGKVEEVRIDSCNEIRYLWESEAEASKVLVNLRNLEVVRCSNLVSLGEKEEGNCGSNLKSLRILDVNDCNSMEVCSCPDNIESLRIQNCDSITSVSFPTGGGGHKLKSLSINSCKELLGEELINNTNMPMLERVFIWNTQILKRIIKLSCFIHLTSLVIRECPSMESFPDDELPNLTSLTHLDIQNCQSMDASFPRGLWPPKLSTLGIGGLKKPISEWGPQNFPTSLVHLLLYGGPSEDVSDFGQLLHLPSSLTSLYIHGFEKVESVSMGLQHLTSLQHLKINDCPKTIDLPEKLLPSLLSLEINGCPNMKERCSKGGSYWPDVSHIPCVQFD